VLFAVHKGHFFIVHKARLASIVSNLFPDPRRAILILLVSKSSRVVVKRKKKNQKKDADFHQNFDRTKAGTKFRKRQYRARSQAGSTGKRRYPGRPNQVSFNAGGDFTFVLFG
jgi:hypothetical protein